MAKKSQISYKPLNEKDEKIIQKRVAIALEHYDCLKANDYDFYVARTIVDMQPSLYILNHDLLTNPNHYPPAVFFAFQGNYGGMVPINHSDSHSERLNRLIAEDGLKSAPFSDAKNFLERRVAATLHHGKLHGLMWPL